MSKQVLVEALKAYKEKGIQDKVLGRIPEEGEQWYIPSERLNTLLGDNEYHLAFVKVVEKSTETEEQDDSVESTEELDLTEEQNTSSESTEESKTTGEEKVNDEPIIIENESLTTKTQKKYSKSK